MCKKWLHAGITASDNRMVTGSRHSGEKCGNTSVGMALIHNGILYIMYRNSSTKTTAEWCTALTERNPLLLYSKSCSQRSTIFSQVRKIKHENFNFGLCFFFLVCNFKTIRCIYTNILHIKQACYYWRYSFSALEMHASYDWQHTAPDIYCNLFPVCPFVCTSQRRRDTIVEYMIVH